MDFAHPVEAVIGGAQGRLLAVLVNVTAPLSLRRLAGLAGVSPAQASRVLPRLVELGIVDRYELPPASQFILTRDNVAAQTIVALADARSTALHQIAKEAEAIKPAPVSILVFGSFARGEADAESDLDVIVVRPDDVDEDDDVVGLARRAASSGRRDDREPGPDPRGAGERSHTEAARTIGVLAQRHA